MKKILFISPSLRQGGVEHSLVTALSVLDLSKYSITLYTYTDMMDLLPRVPAGITVINGVDRTKYFRKPLSILLLLIYYLMKFIGLRKYADRIQNRMYKYIHKLKVEYPYKKYFRKKEFDVVVSYSLHIGTEMSLKIKANKHYVFMHSSDPTYHYETLSKTIADMDKIVCVSEGVKQVYQSVFEKHFDKFMVINNYVDAQQIIKKSKEPFVFEKGNKIILCSCGRLSEEKGFDLAVEAAHILKEKGIDFIWYFIGDGAVRKSIESLIDKYDLNDYVIITGFKENPYPYIKNSDIYVQPSYQEAQPLVILEAMSLGKAVVSTKTVGGKYILKDGKEGVLVDFDGEAIADGIISLAEDDELRKSFENLYTLEDNLKEKQIYIDKLEELLQE